MELAPRRLRFKVLAINPLGVAPRRVFVSSFPTLGLIGALLLGGAADASPPAPAAAPPPASAPANSVHPELWPAGTPAPVDAATEAFVQQLLAHMSLEEKVGQMIQADIASISPAELRTYQLGSILAGGGAAPGDNVRSKPQAWLDLTDD